MIRRLKTQIRTIGIRGLIFKIKAKLRGKIGLFNMRRNDCKHDIWLRIPTSDPKTYRQIFLDKEYDFTVKVPPKIIVDAGANIGLASVFFANRYPEAKIIALEPENSNFEILKKNTYHYKNIVAVQAALWHKNEEINLVDPGRGKWGFMTEDQDTNDNTNRLMGKTCHTVQAITVDQLMKYYEFKKIDILKIDIEGAEKEVFSDCSEWINNVDAIIVELHERMKPGCDRSFYLATNGFENEWKQGENVYLSRNNTIAQIKK